MGTPHLSPHWLSFVKKNIENGGVHVDGSAILTVILSVILYIISV